MKIQLNHLVVRTRQTTEQIDFSHVVTFLHGPVSTGKSTVVRLIDYCLGGNLERTPAIQQEFVAAELAITLGVYDCTIERSADDTLGLRVTWAGPGDDIGSVNAPLQSKEEPLLDAEVYNFSDLIFHLCGVMPIKVRQRSRDPESPMIRLSIRDVWRYCYIDQTHLDSSFFKLEDPFRGRKSQDAMRFFTGLHSERLSQLETELMTAIDDQRTKREAVKQIRAFMTQFDLSSEAGLEGKLQAVEQELAAAKARRAELQEARSAQLHPTDSLRKELRHLGAKIDELLNALSDTEHSIAEQTALRAELITAKTKAKRADQASRILKGVMYERCPECGTNISARQPDGEQCRLCGSPLTDLSGETPLEVEALRRDLNDRIDEIGDSIKRRQLVTARMRRQLYEAQKRKLALDEQLQDELARYDSAFVESIRGVERDIATLVERLAAMQRLQQLPKAIDELEEQAGSLQGRIDHLRSAADDERSRLRAADANIAEIADCFKQVMLTVGFPGVSEDDEVVIDPRNWRPTIIHGDQAWSFWDAGSGGKKTLFNVCYALAIHSVALEKELPLPTLLIIDSPTKNISEDENPDLVRSLYTEIYRIAAGGNNHQLQFLLIDSDLVNPENQLDGFSERRMAGEPHAPSLIPYYVGP